MNIVTEEEIREYIINGGEPITVHNIDTLRDGGTVVIECGYPTKFKYYLHQDDYTIHTGYPTTQDNKLTDDFLKRYLIHRMKTYRDRKYDDVLRIENYIDKINLDN